MFNTYASYSQLLTGAHRKPAPVVRPPVLLWHLAFWAPLEISPRDPGTPQNRDVSKTRAKRQKKVANSFFQQDGANTENATKVRAERNRKVNIYLQNLYRKLRHGKQPDGTVILGITDFSSPNEADGRIGLFSQMMDVAGLHVSDVTPDRARPQYYEAVTFEFRWWGLRTTLRFELHTEYLSLSNYIDLSASQEAADLKRFFDESPPAVRDIYKRLKELDQKLTEDKVSKRYRLRRNDYGPISEALHFGIWEHFYKTFLFTDERDARDLGDVFADFRTVCLGANAPEGYCQTADEPRWTHFQQPFWRNRGDRVPPGSDHRPDSTNSDYWTSKRREFWPLLTAPVRGVEFSNHEFAACTMLDGLAMYVSALGSQPPTLPPGERFPLCYFVYTHTLNGWQIGRLLDQMNFLGTVRMVALMGVDKLKGAALKLWDVEESIKSASEHERLLAHASAASFEDALTKFRECLQRIDDTLVAIEESFRQNVGYRIERSRNYVRQFQAGKSGLGMGPIEGYQPYDEFVERRLGPAFASIELLEIRFQRIHADIARLRQTYIAQETRKVEMVTSDRNKEIGRIQAVADYILFVSLVPYYAGTLFSRIIWPEEHACVPPWYWVLCLGIGLMLASRGLIETLRTGTKRARRATPHVVTLAVGVLLILFAWDWSAQGTSCASLPDWRQIPTKDSTVSETQNPKPL